MRPSPWLVAVAAAVALAGCGEQERSGVRGTVTGSEPAVNAQGAGPADARGRLEANGRQLLPVPPEGLGGRAGERVSGRDLTVLEVVTDTEGGKAPVGLWVGRGERERIFITWRSQPSAQLRVRQLVAVEGTVRRAPDEPVQRFPGIQADGAIQVREQGGYVFATWVR